MAKSVRFTSAWAREEAPGVRRTYPAGWSGSLEDDAAASAVADGAAVAAAEEPAAPASAESATDGVADADTIAADEAMTRAQLDDLARARGIDPEPHRTKADLVAAINGA